MSADNWNYCPGCKARKIEEAEALERSVQESYGKISMEEWDSLRSRAAAAQAAIPDADTENGDPTFREDYEFYGAQTGVVHVRYSGHCSLCNLSIKFTHEHRFWPPEKDTSA